MTPLVVPFGSTQGKLPAYDERLFTARFFASKH